MTSSDSATALWALHFRRRSAIDRAYFASRPFFPSSAVNADFLVWGDRLSGTLTVLHRLKSHLAS